MNFKDSTNLQKISSCGISLFGGLGIYLAAANHLGIARLPALLIALAATFILLFVYRLLLKSASNSPEGSWIYLLPAVAIVFIISINYSGLINLWRDMAVNETPFIIYSLLAASLLLLAGWKGERALWRACPIICAIVIAAIIFDTIFVLPKADPALLLSKVCLLYTSDIVIWHERDTTHSPVEKFIIPDSCLLLDYMIYLFTDVMKNLKVFPERMSYNIEISHGVIFSQRLLLALLRKGVMRDKACLLYTSRCV